MIQRGRAADHEQGGVTVQIDFLGVEHGSPPPFRLMAKACPTLRRLGSCFFVAMWRDDVRRTGVPDVLNGLVRESLAALLVICDADGVTGGAARRRAKGTFGDVWAPRGMEFRELGYQAVNSVADVGVPDRFSRTLPRSRAALLATFQKSIGEDIPNPRRQLVGQRLAERELVLGEEVKEVPSISVLWRTPRSTQRASSAP